MSYNGPSIFVDPMNVKWGSTVSFYGVKRISISKSSQILKAHNNNTLRPIATHKVGEQVTVSIDTEDINAFAQIQAATGNTYDLTFDWIPAEQSLVTAPLAKQTVTMKNCRFESESLDAPSKSIGEYRLTGEVLGLADNTPAITMAVAV